MVCEVFLKRHISIGQKTGPQGFGQGANVEVTAGFAAGHGWNDGAAGGTLAEVLKIIDHKALGVDLDLGFSPTLPALCEWIFAELNKRKQPVCEVRLLRGDGVGAIYRQRSEARSIAPPFVPG